VVLINDLFVFFISENWQFDFEGGSDLPWFSFFFFPRMFHPYVWLFVRYKQPLVITI
jgi:hypothetical protein